MFLINLQLKKKWVFSLYNEVIDPIHEDFGEMPINVLIDEAIDVNGRYMALF